MDSLVGYGSDDDHETDRYGGRHVSGGSGARRREDDTNYEEVNMDMSEDSQGQESEPELPPAERPSNDTHRRGSEDSRERSRAHGGSRERRDGRDRRRESPRRDRVSPRRVRESPRRDRGSPRGVRESPRRDRGSPRGVRDSPRRDRDSPRRVRDSPRRDRDSPRRDRDRREPRRDDKHNRGDRMERGRQEGARRGVPGDRADDRTESKPPALMDLKPFGGEPPPASARSQDARDAVSPRFVDRERRDKDREPRERERDRDNRESGHGRRSEERRSREPRDARPDQRDVRQEQRDVRQDQRDVRPDQREARSRSRGAGAAFPPPHAHTASSGGAERRSPPGDYRPSYKVNRKLEVMEKMGLQIKTPDGSMATAQQLRYAAAHHGAGASPYYNPQASNRILDQVAKRKLLWAHKSKSEAEEAAKWSGTRFAADNDGRQATKFMRLMGIKEPGAVKAEAPEKAADPIKKQEELFEAMQAQYEVARATTHTMRGVGLGFQRGQY